MSYHLREIPVGVFGETSKIREELEELEDAFEQGNYIMALCELSDIYGALKGVLRQYFPNFSMHDLDVMAATTARAFLTGARKEKEQ